MSAAALGGDEQAQQQLLEVGKSLFEIDLNYKRQYDEMSAEADRLRSEGQDDKAKQLEIGFWASVVPSPKGIADNVASAVREVNGKGGSGSGSSGADEVDLGGGGGSIATNRTFDFAPHQQAIGDARSGLPSNLRRGGTVAAARVDIDGVPSTLNGHSRISDPSSVRGGDSFVGQGSNNFRWNESSTADGFPTQGNTHAEYRILDNIADRLGNNTSATGRVDLFIELPPCSASCGGPGGVIQQFRDRYPNIELNVQHNNGSRIRP
jgi:filamentous hemagglutinin